MKKLILIVAGLLLICAAQAQGFSSKGAKEKKFIGTLLEYMKAGPDYAGLMNCVSPAYIEKNKINKADYKVDNYSLYGYSFEKYSRDGMVTVKIWGENRGWVHKLSFKLSKEKGKFYVVPSKFENNYITPWWERETYIKE